jgi:putative phosphoesterase
MIRIGVLSDTHGYLHPGLFEFFRKCDEIWHAGDIGNMETVNRLKKFKPVRAVYGNIDGQELRNEYKEHLLIETEEIKTLLIHIGGYPGRYESRALDLIRKHRPGLFICGHSHILKVIYDKKNELLHINPGAAGKFGSHQKITLIRFALDGKDIRDMEIFESEKATRI